MAELQKKIESSNEAVPLTLVIPTYNCSESIGICLESVKKQAYDPLEVIIIDAGSKDHTLEVVHSYSSLVSRVYTVTTFNVADMINRGISLGTGLYFTFLIPGSFYLSNQTYHYFAEHAIHNRYPDLIHCGSLQRELRREPRMIHSPFDLQLLEKGKHPATLAATWFRADLFDKMGKFDPQYSVRFAYDFFCRFSLNKEGQTLFLDRVYVDFDYGRFTYGKLVRFSRETWLILLRYFGFRKALRWFLKLNHLLTIK